MAYFVPKQYPEDISSALAVLKKYSPKEIFLFSSLKDGGTHPGSDIDIAVNGIGSEDYFMDPGEWQGIISHHFDLVYLDFKDAFTDYLFVSGSLVHKCLTGKLVQKM